MEQNGESRNRPTPPLIFDEGIGATQCGDNNLFPTGAVTDGHVQQQSLNPYFKTYESLTQTDYRPSVRAKTVKLLQENIGGNLSDFGFGKESLNMTQKAQTTTKENIKLSSK